MKKKLILTVTLSLFFALTTIAQQQGKATNKVAENRAERMATELGLTNAEKVKVQALLEKQTIEYKDAKEKLSSKDANFKAKLEALQKKQESELEKLIGKDKFAKHTENRKQEKKRIELAKKRPLSTGSGQ